MPTSARAVPTKLLLPNVHDANMFYLTPTQVQGMTQIHDGAGVHTLAEVATADGSEPGGSGSVLSTTGTAEISSEQGHILITGEDGQSKERLLVCNEL